MNAWIKAGSVVLLTATLAVPAVGLAQVAINTQGPDNPVTFFHNRHRGVVCTTCHAATPSATPPSISVQLSSPAPCQTCHELLVGEEPPKDGCINCHNDISPR